MGGAFGDQRGGDLFMIRRREFIAGLAGAAAWPFLVRAQQQTKPTIGYLSVLGKPSSKEGADAFRRGLAEVGFSAGRDVIIVDTACCDLEQLPALAADLVRRRPALILVPSAIDGLAAKQATQEIPIVFANPVELGLVASLNRPGGNLTGVVIPLAEIAEKRLELLHKAVPAAETIALLSGYGDSPYEQLETRHVQSAARTLGLHVLVFDVTADTEMAAVFATLVEQQVGAALVGAPAFVNAMRDQIISLAARFGLPTMFLSSPDARAGNLLSYGLDGIEASRQLGVYTRSYS
jgi:putative tryptophan/tyrosine transport system substrate-binding protein